jgi:hypothetical protein
MKRKSFKKWRLAAALFAVAALAGAAWAAVTVTYDGTDTSLLGELPDWADAAIFGNASGVGYKYVIGNLGQSLNDSLFPPDQYGYRTGNRGVVTGQNTVVPGLVGGGQSENGDVSDNQVTIEEGALVKVAVIGAGTKNGSATNNHVVIDGTATRIGTGSVDPTQPFGHGQVYGGYVASGSGNAKLNSVTVKSGTIEDAVVGGFIQGPTTGSAWSSIWTTEGSGNAVDNTVTINGGVVNHHIFGGRAVTGNANDNNVVISGIDTTSNVYDIIGGNSVRGAANGNTVDISAEIDHDDRIVGGDGYSTAKGNKVTIGGNADVVTDEIYGGIATNNAGTASLANNNEVLLNGGKVDGNLGDLLIFGGRSNGDNGSEAKGNKVTITGGTQLGSTNTTVKIYGGTVNTPNETGSSKNNIVEISGSPEFNGVINIYAGSSYIGDDVVENNTIKISGVPITVNNPEVSLYGSNGPGGIDNTLELAADVPLAVENVARFQKYKITVPETFNYSTETVLSTTNPVDLAGTTLEVCGIDLDDLDVSDNFNLFSSTNGAPTTISGIGKDGTGIELSLSGGTVIRDGGKAEIADKSKFNFGTQYVGYTASDVDSATLTESDIILSGGWASGPTDQITAVELGEGTDSGFTVSSSAPWIISPKTGLKAGVYNDTLTVTFEFDNGTKTAKVIAPVTFTVADKPAPGGSGGCDAGFGAFAALFALGAAAIIRGKRA